MWGRCAFLSLAIVAAAGLLAAVPAAVHADAAGESADGAPRVIERGMVAVADTSNHRVQVLHPNGTLAFALGSSGGGDADGEFSSPEGVAVHADGTIAVADTGNDRVQVFVNGTFAGKFGSSGEAVGQLDGPRSIAFLPSGGMVAVADTGNDRVQVFHIDGTPAFVFG